MIVRNPAEPGWGLGQVQSRIGSRVTVNFKECGKLVIDTGYVVLQIVPPNGTQ